VCRRIQIEGESEQFLIDPTGRIFDMDGNFIGTTTAECLNELGYPTVPANGNQNQGTEVYQGDQI